LMRQTFSTRRVASAALIAIFAFAGPACKRRKVKVGATEEEAPRMASLIHMGDPKSANQLVAGFYDIEQNAWRWVQKRFSVVLRPPLNAPQKGATLSLKFAIPDVVIGKLQSVTVSTSVNGNALPPETYSKAGEFTYARDVTPNML